MISFPVRFFPAHGKIMLRCRKKLLWHLNRDRSEQILGSGTLRLRRQMVFNFWLSALWFVITSANSLASKTSYLVLLRDESFRPVVSTRHFFPLRGRKGAVFEAVFCLHHFSSCPCPRTIWWTCSYTEPCSLSPCESHSLAWARPALSMCPLSTRTTEAIEAARGSEKLPYGGCGKTRGAEGYFRAWSGCSS